MHTRRFSTFPLITLLYALVCALHCFLFHEIAAPTTHKTLIHFRLGFVVSVSTFRSKMSNSPPYHPFVQSVLLPFYQQSNLISSPLLTAFGYFIIIHEIPFVVQNLLFCFFFDKIVTPAALPHKITQPPPHPHFLSTSYHSHHNTL